MSGCVDAGDPPGPNSLRLPAGDLEREDVGLLKPDCFTALPIDLNQHPCPQSAPPQRLRLFPVATNQIAISRSTTWNSIPPIG